MTAQWEVREGDCLSVMAGMADGSVNCCVTSPPYFGLRDYGHEGQMGLEPTPEEYVAKMVAVFREVRRVLRDDGTLWLNLGDSYAGNASGGGAGTRGGLAAAAERSYGKPRNQQNRSDAALFRGVARAVPAGFKAKDLLGIPWTVALALRADGWYLRSDIIWHKPNPMPESVRDRPTKSHEYVFLLAKSGRYYYDAAAVAEPSVGEPPVSRMRLHSGLKAASLQSLAASTLGTPADGTRNSRTVWSIATRPFKGAHFAVMPEALAEKCVLAGCPVGGTVIDPFTGSGTVGVVAVKNGRGFVGAELNPEYAAMARTRIAAAVPEPTLDFGEAA